MWIVSEWKVLARTSYLQWLRASLTSCSLCMHQILQQAGVAQLYNNCLFLLWSVCVSVNAPKQTTQQRGKFSFSVGFLMWSNQLFKLEWSQYPLYCYVDKGRCYSHAFTFCFFFLALLSWGVTTPTGCRTQRTMLMWTEQTPMRIMGMT